MKVKLSSVAFSTIMYLGLNYAAHANIIPTYSVNPASIAAGGSATEACHCKCLLMEDHTTMLILPAER
jgi:hypothetical protein